MTYVPIYVCIVCTHKCGYPFGTGTISANDYILGVPPGDGSKSRGEWQTGLAL